MQCPPEFPKVRRACATLTATLALAAVALPSVLLLGQPPATASTSQLPGSPVSLAITGMTPGWATPTATITVRGTVTNDSRQSISGLAVQLDTSSQPIGSLSQLQAELGSSAQLAYSALSGHPQVIASPLPPGDSAAWSISFPARAAGMTDYREDVSSHLLPLGRVPLPGRVRAKL